MYFIGTFLLMIQCTAVQVAANILTESVNDQDIDIRSEDIQYHHYMYKGTCSYRTFCLCNPGNIVVNYVLYHFLCFDYLHNIASFLCLHK